MSSANESVATLPSTAVGGRRLRRSLAGLLAVAVIGVLGFAAVPTRSADAAPVSLLNCEFGKFQVFDVQWSISDDTLFVSGVVPPYTAYPTSHALTVDPPDPELLDTDYFKFVATDYVVPNPNPGSEVAIGFEQYASDGTLKLRMQEYGVFRAFGPGFIFYLGEGSWGTVITTGEALEYGSSAQLPVTRDSSDSPITEAEMLQYQCDGSPLPPPGYIPVTVTGPTASFTAGDPIPDLTPTVEPSEGLLELPTCAIYAASDTGFVEPVEITAASPAGDYVTHCSGGVLAEGYGPITFEDGAFTVAAAPDPTTTTSTSIPETTTTMADAGAQEEQDSGAFGLPLTGRDSIVPMFLIALTMVSLGAAMVLAERTRRQDVVPSHGFSTVTLPPPPVVVAPVAAPVAAPVVEAPVVEAPVVEAPVVEAPVVEAPVVEAPVVEAPIVEAPVVEAPVVVLPALEIELEPEPVAPVRRSAREIALERSALERRLATLQGRTDATSLRWARSLQAKLDALGD